MALSALIFDRMNLWRLLSLALLGVFFVASAVPVVAQGSTTIVAPGGVYTVEVTVQKPSGMSLSKDWEIRVYVFSDTNYYTTGSWWESGGEWIYSGTYDHRIRNQPWTTPNEKTFPITIQLVNYPRGSEGPAYPPDLSENEAKSRGYYMDEILNENGSPKSVTLRTRLIFRNLSPPEFSGDKVKFKIADTTYEYKYRKDQYNRYWLKTPDGGDVGSGAYLDQVSGTGEWRLNYRSNDVKLIVSENGPTTGTIVVPNPIVIGLEPAGAGLPIWVVGVGAGIIVVVLVFVFSKRKKEEIRSIEMPPPPFQPPPAPPQPQPES